MIYAAVAAILILAVLAGSYYAYRIAFYAPPGTGCDPRELPDDEQFMAVRDRLMIRIDEMDALPYEQIYIRSKDGLRLAARYYHVSDGAPLHIQCHGYHGNAVRDFCGGNLLVRMMGHNSLVIDQRAHGKSEGRTITFGIREREDCLQWIEYCCKRFGKDVPIVLSGVSMGAATVLMATGLDLPENVVGVMADCPYSSPSAIIRKVCDDMKLPSGPVYPFVYLGALIFGGFRLSGCTTVDAVRHAKIPVLIMHGEDDRFVTCDMSREIFEACASPKELYTFPDAGHGLSYVIDPERYRELSRRFVARVTGRNVE